MAVGGPVKIVIKATDKAGNTATATINVTVTS
jgi:hypothetical protein